MTPDGDGNVKLFVEDGIARVILDRPGKRNALDMPMLAELKNVLESAVGDSEVRVVVLSSSGPAFCAGGDIRAMAAAASKPDFLYELAAGVQDCCRIICRMDKPVIAVVEGPASGAGLALVLACDIVFASDTAVFNTSFVNIGLAPGCGTFFMSRAVGYQKAFELFMAGRNVTASEAAALGFVNDVAEDTHASAMDTASRIAALSPAVVSEIKGLMHATYGAGMEEQFDRERRAIASAGGTREFLGHIARFQKK